MLDNIEYCEHNYCKTLKANLEGFLSSTWNFDIHDDIVTNKTTVEKLLEQLDKHIIKIYSDFTELTEADLIEPENCLYPAPYALAALEKSMDTVEQCTPEYLEKWISNLSHMWWPDFDIGRDFDWDETTHTLTLTTGGWSGNEDILAALDKIQLLNMVCEPDYKKGGRQMYDFSRFYDWKEARKLKDEAHSAKYITLEK